MQLENYTFLTFVCQTSEPNVYAASKVVTSKGFSNVLNIPRDSRRRGQDRTGVDPIATRVFPSLP